MGRIDNPEILDGAPDRKDDAALRIGLQALYRSHGKACANMLRGDFALGFSDPVAAGIVCFRDICGCQPVYYNISPSRLSIAASVADLVSDRDISREIDAQFVVPALSRFFDHPERTFLKHVRKVPPAHVLTIRRDGIEREVFWRADDVPAVDYSDPEKVHAEFRDLFTQAVRNCLPADGETGVHVSGGLDCSAVAILASRILAADGKPRPRAYAWQPLPAKVVPDGTGVYRDLAPDVYEAIESVCNVASLEPTYCPVSKDDFLEVWQRDDTIDRICGNTYSEWPVQRAAQAQSVKHILSGFGGDEVASFSGRGYPEGLALKGKWMTLCRLAQDQPGNPVRFMIASLRNGLEALLLPEWVFSRYRVEVVSKIPRWKVLARILLGTNHTEFLLNDRERKSAAHMFSYLSLSALTIANPLPFWKTSRQTSARRAMQDVFESGNLTYRIESWANDGAKHGIRYHYPLLDKRIIELIFGLPEDAFRDGKHRRLFYKTAMSPILPPSVCWKPKLNEVARATNALAMLKPALIEFGKKLDAGALDMSRSSFIDIEKLSRSLKPKALEGRDYLAKVFFAVQFLGMKPK